MPAEEWHYVGDTGEPAFQNGWQAGSVTVATTPTVVLLASLPAFRNWGGGLIELQGIADTGTPGATVFTLPEAYRPSHMTFINVTGSISGTMSSGIVTISTTGEVKGYRSGSHHDTLLINGMFNLWPTNA